MKIRIVLEVEVAEQPAPEALDEVASAAFAQLELLGEERGVEYSNATVCTEVQE